ncbi:MAG: UDP-N-acetylglucosamine 4,6-dehydratase (inverting) [Candidatus Aureabacteria bacterium]|nr:UDP-N-acetylglucosamine 4,6-dehydratase (inverting) [Candidatus Auribacterota bacterium]
MIWHDKKILITGGTGSFGRAFVARMLENYHPRVIRIYSRDEMKQYQMRADGFVDKSLRYFIGDVRDRDRLEMAVRGVDIIIHAAALKQVPSCEYNPFEAVKTNVLGAQNIIQAALDNNVSKVVALSTDKAVNPINLYGATKLCAEKIFIESNSYAGDKPVRFSCVRYGNVLGSRGSVIPVFKKQKESGVLTITDKRMTRFWITLEQAVEFVIHSLEEMAGGEVFVPKAPSMKMTDLAEAIAPGCTIKEIGIRPGEKIHEVLVTRDESRHTREVEDFFVIEPEYHWWTVRNWTQGKLLPEGYEYRSDMNSRWLDKAELLALLENPLQPRKT